MNITTPYPVCPTSLGESEIDRYNEQGFLVFERGLSAGEVETARAALSDIVGDFVAAPDGWTAKSSKMAGGESIHVKKKDDVVMMQLEAGLDPEGKSAEEVEIALRKYMWFHDAAPIFKEIYTSHPKIQGVVQSILGDQIELYQSMALVKPPKIGIDKPWHQDNAYFSVQDPRAILGTWIALDDTTVENGCMHFIPGGHIHGPRKHHHTHDCEIVSDRIDTSRAVAVEIPAGSIIFFSGNIPHYTPPNHSDARRRALQYHYRTSANAIIPAEEYDAIFTETDGSPASCSAARRDGF